MRPQLTTALLLLVFAAVAFAVHAPLVGVILLVFTVGALLEGLLFGEVEYEEIVVDEFGLPLYEDEVIIVEDFD